MNVVLTVDGSCHPGYVLPDVNSTCQVDTEKEDILRASAAGRYIYIRVSTE